MTKISSVIAALAALALVGCATPRICMTRTDVQTVPQPVWLPIPPALSEPIKIEPLPTTGTNPALLEDHAKLEAALDKCQDDREALRRLNQRGEGGKDA